jgi:hypothetical protein
VGCDVTDSDIEKMKRFRGRYQQMALAGKIQIKKKKVFAGRQIVTGNYGSSKPGLVAQR